MGQMNIMTYSWERLRRGGEREGGRAHHSLEGLSPAG